MNIPAGCRAGRRPTRPTPQTMSCNHTSPRRFLHVADGGYPQSHCAVFCCNTTNRQRCISSFAGIDDIFKMMQSFTATLANWRYETFHTVSEQLLRLRRFCEVHFAKKVVNRWDIGWPEHVASAKNVLLRWDDLTFSTCNLQREY